jgi:ribonuclease H2 subunit B
LFVLVHNIIPLVRNSGTATCYLVAPDGRLQELHWFKQSYAAWFIGDFVCSDGSLYIASPVDPIYMILPILEQVRMKARTSPA